MEFSFPDLFLKSEHLRGRRGGQSKGSKISGNFLNWVKRANPDPAKIAGRPGSSDLPTLSIFSSGISNPLDLINLEPKTDPELKPGRKWVKKGGVPENSLNEAAQVAALLVKKAELGLNGAKMAVSPKESAKDLAVANVSDSKATDTTVSGKQKGQEPGTAPSALLAMLKKAGVGKELRAGTLKGSADRELSKADREPGKADKPGLNSSKHNEKGSKSAIEPAHEMGSSQIAGAKDAVIAKDSETRLKQAHVEGTSLKKATEPGPEAAAGNQKTGKANDQTGKDPAPRNRHQGMAVHEGYEAEVIARESGVQTTSRLHQKSREEQVIPGQKQAAGLPHTTAGKPEPQTAEMAKGPEQIRSATQALQGEEKIGKLKTNEKSSIQGKSHRERIGKDGKATQRPYVGSEPPAGSGAPEEKAQGIHEGLKGHTSTVKPDSSKDPFGIAMGTENKSGPANTSGSKGRAPAQHWSDYAQDATKTAPSSEPAAIQKTVGPEGARVPQPLFNQVEDGLKQAFILRPKSITVKLNPDDLGEIKVKVSIENDNLHARIQTESARVTSILKDQQGELEHRLRDQGIDLKKFDISDNSQDQQGNREPHQRNPEQAAQRNGNGRRTALNPGQENRQEPQPPVQTQASPSITPGQPVNITI